MWFTVFATSRLCVTPSARMRGRLSVRQPFSCDWCFSWFKHCAGGADGLHVFRVGAFSVVQETPNMVFTQGRGFVVGESFGWSRSIASVPRFGWQRRDHLRSLATGDGVGTISLTQSQSLRLQR